MQLGIEDFNDNPSQTVDLKSHMRSQINRISLWVFANNIGDAHAFRFYMEDSDSNVVFDQTLTGAQIKSNMDKSLTYFHGKLFLTPANGVLMLDHGQYTFKCQQLTGYSGSTYLSWCKDWERPFDATNEAPTYVENAPFFIRFYNKEVQL